MLVVTGCLKGRVLAVSRCSSGRHAERSDRQGAIVPAGRQEGRHERRQGIRRPSRRRHRHREEVVAHRTGRQGGQGRHDRRRTAGRRHPAAATPVPTEYIPVLDVESVRSRATSCGSRRELRDRPGLRTRASERVVDEGDEIVWRHHALAPLRRRTARSVSPPAPGRASSCARFMSCTRSRIVRNDAPVFQQPGVIRQRTVAWHDLRPRVRHRQRPIGAGDHAVDVAAGAGVDERIHPVEEHVPHVQHVGLRVVHENVAYRYARARTCASVISSPFIVSDRLSVNVSVGSDAAGAGSKCMPSRSCGCVSRVLRVDVRENAARRLRESAALLSA